MEKFIQNHNCSINVARVEYFLSQASNQLDHIDEEMKGVKLRNFCNFLHGSEFNLVTEKKWTFFDCYGMAILSGAAAFAGFGAGMMGNDRAVDTMLGAAAGLAGLSLVSTGPDKTIGYAESSFRNKINIRFYIIYQRNSQSILLKVILNKRGTSGPNKISYFGRILITIPELRLSEANWMEGYVGKGEPEEHRINLELPIVDVGITLNPGLQCKICFDENN